MLDEVKLKSLFLQLLRSAMWKIESDTSLLPISDPEWQWIYTTAMRHTMQSVVFDAITSLPEPLRPKGRLMTIWSESVARQEKAYLGQLRTVNYLYGRFQASDITPVVLKGLVLSSCYPYPQHRFSGDIDLFYGSVDRKREADDVIEGWGIHIQRLLNEESIFMLGNVVVENHGHLFLSYNPLVRTSAKKRLLDVLSSRDAYCQVDIQGSDITTLNPTLALLQLVSHSYKHVINSGIGLRQMADIALFLSKERDRIQRDEFSRWASDWKMIGWTRCLMTALIHYLGMPDEFSPVESGSMKDADTLMEEIWQTANFGQGDIRFSGTTNSSTRKDTFRRLLHNYRLFARHSYGEATGALLLLIYNRIKESMHSNKSSC